MYLTKVFFIGILFLFVSAGFIWLSVPKTDSSAKAQRASVTHVPSTGSPQEKKVLAADTSSPLTLSSEKTTNVNLIKNSSFEKESNGQPRGWSYLLDSITSNTFLSQEGNRSGTYGLKFVGGTNDNLGLMQPTTKTVPGRTYTLSAYVKVVNASSHIIRLGFWDEYHNKEGEIKDITFSGTKDWTRISLTVTTPGVITDTTNEFPLIEVIGLSKGTVYLDDVQLSEGNDSSVYNSAQAKAGTVAALGDGSVSFSTDGTIMPTYAGEGQLGTTTNPFSALYLSSASIDSSGNLWINDASVSGTLTLPDITTNGLMYTNGSSEITSFGFGTSGYLLQSNGTTNSPSWVASSSFTSGDSNSLLGATWAAPGAIGSTTPNTGAFTTLTATTGTLTTGTITNLTTTASLSANGGITFPDDNFLQTSSSKHLSETTGIMIPMYIYPSNVYTNTTYNNLIALKKKYHNVPLTVILNNSNGPGAARDGNFTVAITRLHGAGITVLGYVSTSYATRASADVKTDIDTWLSFYPAVDGIFFDEMTNDSDTTHITYYADLTSYSHGKSLYPIVGNSGTVMPQAYFDSNTADIINTVENSSFPSESSLQGDFAGGNMDYDYNRRSGLVYGQSTLSYSELKLVRKYLGNIYITDDSGANPWDTISTYLESIFQALDNANDVAFDNVTVETGLTTTTASISANNAYAGLIVDNQGTGDLFTASSSGLNRFVINQNGNIGIGTRTPGFALDVQQAQSATVAAQIVNTDTGTDADGLLVKLGNTATSTSTTNHWISFEQSGIGIVGSIQGNGSGTINYKTNGIADFAEYMEKDPQKDIFWGSILCLNENGLVSPCTDENQKIVGIASEFPTFTGGVDRGDKSITVGFTGIVKTRVSAENGAIVPGDFITITSKPGVGAKATKTGMVVGRAINPYHNTIEDGVILVALQMGWNGVKGDSSTNLIDRFMTDSPVDLADENIDIKDGQFMGTLQVAGRTTLTDVGITGEATIGVLTITGLDDSGVATINTLSGELHLQSDGLHGIDILHGKITIDPTGNMSVKGELTTKKLNIAIDQADAPTIGEVRIPAGETTAEVKTSALTDKSKIFVEPRKIPVATAIDKKNNQAFTLRIGEKKQEDIIIDWWIIN